MVAVRVIEFVLADGANPYGTKAENSFGFTQARSTSSFVGLRERCR